MTPIVQSHLRLEPSPLALRALSPWLKTAIDSLDPAPAPDLFSRAELAVHEACMNVIDHAELPPNSMIELELTLGPDSLTVQVRDPGEEFDLAAVPAPDPMGLGERGYGVKIIRSLVSVLVYRRNGDMNELEMRIDTEGLS
ncbi:ATP-binding protein [Subtercola sp. PAMC28395]|uniref:ATP-binding protein n=1 Tax=Subtercola sp. PAMC28395 TaxID=2846775 RepID=UPI001C0ABCEA|nr:ATP-binding protein [Subtercola sp. PAMC28395]QWT24316.1 ATP-binding protein [Subtercola sp. PAMC28395]